MTDNNNKQNDILKTTVNDVITFNMQKKRIKKIVQEGNEEKLKKSGGKERRTIEQLNN
jgi:hypothetical protein